MKLCIDCKWFRHARCRSPLANIDFVGNDDGNRSWRGNPRTQREYGWFWKFPTGTCGKSGRFWEAKPQ